MTAKKKVRNEPLLCYDIQKAHVNQNYYTFYDLVWTCRGPPFPFKCERGKHVWTLSNTVETRSYLDMEPYCFNKLGIIENEVFPWYCLVSMHCLHILSPTFRRKRATLATSTLNLKYRMFFNIFSFDFRPVFISYNTKVVNFQHSFLIITCLCRGLVMKSNKVSPPRRPFYLNDKGPWGRRRISDTLIPITSYQSKVA